MNRKEDLLTFFRSRIFKNISALMILQGANYLIPLLVMPYMIRVLGLANFGLYSFAQAISLYLIVLTDYGFSISAAKSISINRDNKIELSKIFHSVLLIKFMLLVFISAVYIGSIFSIDKLASNYEIYLYSLGILFGQTFIPIWFFQGMEKMKFITIVNVLLRLIFAILLVVLVSGPEDVLLAMISQAFSYILASAISMYIVYRYFKLKVYLPSWNNLTRLMKDGKHVFLSTVSISLYRNANTIILGAFAGDLAVGVYSSAEKIIRAIQSVISPVSQALYPSMSYKFSKVSVQKALTEILKIGKYYGIVLLVISLVVFTGEPFIEDLLNIDNESFKVTFYLLIPVIFFGSLNYLLGIVGLVNLNKEKFFSRITIFAGVLNVVMSILLAPKFGALGVALSLCVSEISIMMLILLIMRKMKKVHV